MTNRKENDSTIQFHSIVEDFENLSLLKGSKKYPTHMKKLDKALGDENINYLRNMAKYFPVILVSSIKRDDYNTPVSMSSFKESGSIEYAADVILGRQFSAVGTKKNFDINEEKSKNPRNVDITILKQRYGQSGGCPLSL